VLPKHASCSLATTQLASSPDLVDSNQWGASTSGGGAGGAGGETNARQSSDIIISQFLTSRDFLSIIADIADRRHPLRNFSAIEKMASSTETTHSTDPSTTTDSTRRTPLISVLQESEPSAVRFRLPAAAL